VADQALSVKVVFPPATLGKIDNLKRFPGQLVGAVRRGMDSGLGKLVWQIKNRRLSGFGPFPVDEHRLGIRSAALWASVEAKPSAVVGNKVIGSITADAENEGFPYGIAHEYGATVTATNAPFLVFRIGDRLIRTKSVVIPARAPFTTEIQSPETAAMMSNEIADEIGKAWDRL